MVRLLWWLAVAGPLAAHMVSISTGSLHVAGNTARYQLRMPLYETEAMKNPRQVLFGQFRLSDGGVSPEPRKLECRREFADGLFVCDATYKFPRPVKKLRVECRYYKVTVPNHVHIIRAERKDATEQVVFDLTAPVAEVTFIPPTAWMVARTQLGAGVRRAMGGSASLLFLLALVVAARSRRELGALTGAFVAGQVVACFLLPITGWEPPARFVEAAAALTIAYLAIEILLLPKAGQRWAVVGVLGGFHGLYLAMFVQVTGFSAALVLAGAVLTDLILIAVIALAWSRIRGPLGPLRPVPLLAAGLLLFGLTWFFFRLRG